MKCGETLYETKKTFIDNDNSGNATDDASDGGIHSIGIGKPIF